MSKENLSEADINAKSTSDKRKRRLAHVPKFPLPVIKKPILPVIKKKKKLKFKTKFKIIKSVYTNLLFIQVNKYINLMKKQKLLIIITDISFVFFFIKLL